MDRRGIRENETTDKLAKKGATMQQPDVPVIY